MNVAVGDTVVLSPTKYIGTECIRRFICTKDLGDVIQGKFVHYDGVEYLIKQEMSTDGTMMDVISKTNAVGTVNKSDIEKPSADKVSLCPACVGRALKNKVIQ